MTSRAGSIIGGVPRLLAQNASIPSAPAPAATTWNPADLQNITLSPDKLTASQTAANAQVRSTTSHGGTDKVHFEYTIIAGPSGTAGNMVLGIADSSYLFSNYLGGPDTIYHSLGLWNNPPMALYMNGGNIGLYTGTSYVNGDTVAIEVDFGAQNFYANNVTQGSGWVGPTTFNYGPMSAGPFFAALEFYSAGGGSATINFGATPFAATPQAGFSAWDAGVVTGATVDLAGNLSPSTILNADLSIDNVLVGDLAPSTIFVGETANFLAEAGDLAITPAFAAAMTPFVGIAGDLAPSTVFVADTANLFVLAGDLAPSTTFVGDAPVNVALVGDLAPSTVFAGDLPVDHPLSGDLAPSIAFAGDIPFTRDLAGDLAPSTTFIADTVDLIVLAGNLSVTPALSAVLDILVVGATTFNPADLFSITLSDANLTATSNNNPGDNKVRSTTSRASPSKVHVEFTILTGVSGGGIIGVGIANAASDITSNYIGIDNNSVACFNNNPQQWFYNNSNNLHLAGISCGAGDTIALEFDLSANTCRFQNFTQNPGVWNQGLGDYSFSGLNAGPYFICVDFDTSPPVALTANFGVSAPVVAISSGYAMWDAVGTTVDLAGNLAPSISFLGVEVTDEFFIGDLLVVPVFAAETGNLLAFVGDLSPSVAFAGDAPVDKPLTGDLAPSTVFAADLAITPAGLFLTGDLAPAVSFSATFVQTLVLSGDMSPSITFAVDMTPFVGVAGDLAPSVAFSAYLGTPITFAGDLAPSIAFSGDLGTSSTGGSAYGRGVYGKAKYSAYTPGFQDSIGDLSPSIAFAAALSVVETFAGDLAPSVVLRGDFDINNLKTFNGDLAPAVTFGASLSVNITLAGDLAPSVVLRGTFTGDVLIVGGLATSVAFNADLTLGGWQPVPPAALPWQPATPCPPSLWTPIDCAPVDWEKTEPCSG